MRLFQGILVLVGSLVPGAVGFIFAQSHLRPAVEHRVMYSREATAISALAGLLAANAGLMAAIAGIALFTLGRSVLKPARPGSLPVGWREARHAER